MKECELFIFSQEEMEVFLELVYIGNEVVNGCREMPLQKYSLIFNKIYDKYKALLLKSMSEADLKQLNRNLEECCLGYIVEYEDAGFCEALAYKLTHSGFDYKQLLNKLKEAGIFQDVNSDDYLGLRDKLKQTGIFEETDMD